jgi:hypothetical protein
LFYRTSYDLEQYLKRTYPQRTVYIGFNDTNYFITPDTFGYTGCVGVKSTSSKTENHEVNKLFYRKLSEIYLHLISSLDLSLGKLEESLHSITMDAYTMPIATSREEIIPRILQLVPKYLPNHNNRQVLFPLFEQFFKKIVLNSHDFDF